MLKLFDRNSTKLTISEFYDNYSLDKYNFEVAYQRKSNVWAEDKRSFLIDSIMKNYPMPPLFMRPIVDADTGRTKYDIVDGKQRLQSIVSFIKDEIPLTSYFFEDEIFVAGAGDIEKEISGKFFSEIKSDKKFGEFIKQFWTYSINIDYLYEDDIDLISNIFDRLNRNGEPLTHQELRNAKYYKTHLLATIKKLAKNEYWNEHLEKLEIARMEDEQFISELFFLTAKDELFDSLPTVIDRLYEEYSTKGQTAIINEIKSRFIENTNFIKELGLDYSALRKLNQTTHLYGLYSLAWHCVMHDIPANAVREPLISLYTEYFGRTSKAYSDDAILEYKNSCSSRTKSKGQRSKRLNAILKYCGLIK